MKEISEMTMAELSYRKGEVMETISQVEQAMDTEIHNHVFTGDKKLNNEIMMRLSLRIIETKLQREQIKLRQTILLNDPEERVAAKIASPYHRC